MMIRKTNINLLVSACMCVYANCKTIVKTIAASLKLKFYCDQNLNYYGQQSLTIHLNLVLYVFV